MAPTKGIVGPFAPTTPAGPSGGDRPTGVGPTGYNAAGPTAAPLSPQAAILKSDPAYAQAETDATESAGDAAANRTAAIRQAILQYGGVPQGFQDQYGDADAATEQAAAANPYSQLAQATRQQGQTQEADRQGEAANGSIFSGQTPTDIGNEDYNFGATLGGLGSQFGQSVQDAIGAYTGTLASNRTNLTNALFSAEKNEQTNPAYSGSFAPTKTPITTAPAKPAVAPKPVTPQDLVQLFRSKTR